MNGYKIITPKKIRRLRKKLDLLYSQYQGIYLGSDPVCVVHRFKEKKDIETAGLLAALFAFGRAELIIKSLGQILDRMGNGPALYLTTSTEKKISSDFKGFTYRFVGEGDMAAFLISLKICLQNHGSPGAFLSGISKEAENSPFPDTMKHPLKDEKAWRMLGGLRKFLFETGMEAARRNRIKSGPGFSFLLADPSKTSACKRWFLFFRWMVRKDEIDFGIWDFLTPGQLLIPVDTHIARIGGLIGLTTRKGANAAMVREITENLRKINPVDPLKYDFALTRLGILKECPGIRSDEICGKCMINEVCGNR